MTSVVKMRYEVFYYTPMRALFFSEERLELGIHHTLSEERLELGINDEIKSIIFSGFFFNIISWQSLQNARVILCKI